MNKEKTTRMQRVELIDKWGRTRAVFGAEQGVPYIAHYDGKGRILSWLTFLVDGTPEVRVFGEDGSGIELAVDVKESSLLCLRLGQKVQRFQGNLGLIDKSYKKLY
jgi:hypothetical protein